MSASWINIDKLGSKGMEPDLMPPHREPNSLDIGMNVRAIGPNLGNAGGYSFVSDLPSGGELPGYEPPNYPPEKCGDLGAPTGWRSGGYFPSTDAFGASGVFSNGQILLGSRDGWYLREDAATYTPIAARPGSLSLARGCAGVDDLFYVCGGFESVGQEYTTACHGYDRELDSWETLAFLPIDREGFTASAIAAAGKYIYLFGGKPLGTGAYSTLGTEVWKYNTESNIWLKEPTPLPAPSAFGVAVTLRDGRIILVHGEDEADLRTCSIFTPSTGAVEQIDPLPPAAVGGVAGHGLLLPNGNMYFLNGSTGTVTGGSQTFEYQVDSGQWVQGISTTGDWSWNVAGTLAVWYSFDPYCTVVTQKNQDGSVGTPDGQP